MKKPDISSLERTSLRCQYHVVFAPKYRRIEIYREIRVDVCIKEFIGSFAGSKNIKA